MNSQETVIGGLLPETTYSVTVAAYTTKGDGARSKPKVITTTGAGECREHLPQPRRGGGKTSQEVHGEYGQGICAGGREWAGDTAEVHTLVISKPLLTGSATGSPELSAANRWTDTARARERAMKLMGLSSSA